MNFPSSYDTELAEWALAEELVVLTLSGAITALTGTSMTFNEVAEVANLNTPTYLTFLDEDTAGGFEIVKITATYTGGVCDVDRGALSSTAMTHSDDAQATQDPVSAHFSSIRTLLLGIEKYHGLVGLESALPGTCVAGESYMATDTDAFFYAVAANTWREVNELDHATLESSSLLDDDHNTKPYRYHTDARKLLWHSADSDYTNTPVGTHITKVAHNHDGTSDDGQPVARLEHGLESARPGTPSYDGQVYYATDTGDLWIGNSSSWVKYSVMPIDTIIMFEEACPQGWSELTAVQERYPRGAPTGVTSGFTDGGSATHDHDMPDVISHSHTVAAVADIELVSAFHHGHSKDRHSWIAAVAECTYSGQFSTFYEFWRGHSSHTHSVTFPAHDSNDTGNNPATSDAGTSLIPYANLVFCIKD